MLHTFKVELCVATVLTACGIETLNSGPEKPVTAVATVLTACGIETYIKTLYMYKILIVATVLTACGIETDCPRHLSLLVI